MIPLQSSYPVTHLADPRSPVQIRVLGRVLVPTWAVRFFFLPHARLSALNIDLSRNGLQMSWITAARNAAKVIDIKTFWNRANQEFVSNSVHGSHSAIKSNVPVATTVNGTDPQPAARIGLNDNLVLHAFRKNANFDLKHTGLIVAEMLRWGQFI